MANFCKYCGNPLKEGARFCTACGKQIAEIQSEPQEKTPAPEKPKPDIGEKAVQTTKTAAKTAAVKTVGAFAGQLAPSGCGETTLGSFGGGGTFAIIAGGIKHFFTSVKNALKNPKRLIPILILAAVWLILIILQLCGISPFPVRALSFLSFANGGMYGGFFGAIGGIIGKGLFAGALMSVISLVVNRKGGGTRSFGDTVKSFFSISLDTLWAYLAGIGMAVLFYLFISGGATRISFMGGIAASFLAARATLLSGFMQRLIGSITSKFKGGTGIDATAIMRGLTVGFAGAALLGLLGINFLLIFFGSLLADVGIVMMVLQATGTIKFGKEVKGS